MPPVPLPDRFAEKRGYEPLTTAPQLSHTLRILRLARRITLTLSIVFALAFCLNVRERGYPWNEGKPEKTFSWDGITPTADIRWHSCFTSFQCARLSVPLDYNNPTTSPRAAIALTALPATIPATSPHWSGPLLLNPGGPGGSGVEFILSAGHKLRRTAGENHTIIGFDPRGIGLTTPATSCFPSHQDRLIWFLRAAGKIIRAPNIRDAYARSKSLGYVCDQQQTGRFIGTPNVARDMLEITERVWEAAGYSGEGKGLRYWGFSYGTVLGMTYAAMFPERVERMVIDGVMDIGDYYGGGWRRSLVDADAVVDGFFTYCAGSADCAFTGDTPSAVEKRLHALLGAVEQTPLPTYNAEAPDWVSVDDIYTLIFWSLYNPIQRYPILARALRDVEKGETSLITQLLHFHLDPPTCPAPPLGPNTGVEADSAILCTDGDTNNATLAEFESYLSHLNTQSKWIAGNWARIQMACVGWIQPPLSQRGLLFTPPREGETVKTSYPLLFVGNTRDPVTPRGNAVAMQRRFEGSRLLTLEADGHCSLAVPSPCGEGVIRGYFNGDTEEEGKETERCAANQTPFGEETVVGWEVVGWDPVGDGGWAPKVPGWR